VIEADTVPLFAHAAAFAQKGFVTGASKRNWASYGASVVLPAEMPQWRRDLFTDPQTSGGLLIACEAAAAQGVLDKVRGAGFAKAAIIGRVEAGAPEVRVA
jgi:selenide,water dikinase